MKIWKRVGLSVLSGVLVILAFDPVGWWPLVLVAWVPLLMAVEGASFRVGFRLGVLQGLVSFGGVLSWMVSIFGTLAPGLWLILALFPGLFGGLATQLSGRWKVVLVAVCWTGLEYLRGEHFWLSFPWVTPGTGWEPGALDAVVGVYGVSFLVILTSGFLVGRNWVRAAVGVGVLVGSLFLGGEVEEGEIEVGLVQSESMNYDHFREMSKELVDEVEVILWPEYAMGFDPREVKSVPEEIGALVEGRTKLLVLGGKMNLDEVGEWSNTAYVFGGEGEVVGRHFKNHTVHLFNDGKAGEEATFVETELGKVGTPVCFDCDHQDVIRRMTGAGAEVFLIPSMDAAHWSARQHEQHGRLFRHRAAENGRWLAVAATSGLSQIVNPNGEVVGRLPLMEDGVMRGRVGLRDGRTLFQRGGWLVGPGCLLGFVLLGGWLIFEKMGKSGVCKKSLTR